MDMFKNLVLLQTDITALYSYFPNADNRIEFYGISDDKSRKKGQLLGYIANSGEKAVKLTFTWGEVQLCWRQARRLLYFMECR